MKIVLGVAAAAEAGTGLALVIVPSLVGRLLLGQELSGVSVVIGRVTGIAICSLALACWPRRRTNCPGLCAMLTYSLLITLYMLYLGIRGEWVGPLLWAATAWHAVMTLLLAWAWFKLRKHGSA